MKKFLLLFFLVFNLFFISIAIANDVSYYVYDSPGRSVTSLVNTSSGVITAYNYDSFGNIINNSNPGINNNIQYTGQQEDKETGLIFLRNRYYIILP